MIIGCVFCSSFRIRFIRFLIISLKLLDSDWPLSSEETGAVLDFAPIASQFFNITTQNEDPNEHLAIPGPSTNMNQNGASTQENVSFILKYHFYFVFLITDFSHSLIPNFIIFLLGKTP